MKTINIKVLAITITLVLSCIIIGCQKEEFEEIQEQEFWEEYSSDLAITDFKNWLKSQDITHEYIREQTPNWSNVEFKVLPDGNSSQVSIEMYKGKNSLGNDSIIELQVAHVKNR